MRHARSTNNGRKIQESSWPNTLVSDDEDLPPPRSMARVAKPTAKFPSPLPMIGPYVVAEDDALPPPRLMSEAKPVARSLDHLPKISIYIPGDDDLPPPRLLARDGNSSGRFNPTGTLREHSKADADGMRDTRRAGRSQRRPKSHEDFHPSVFTHQVFEVKPGTTSRTSNTLQVPVPPVEKDCKASKIFFHKMTVYLLHLNIDMVQYIDGCT